MKELRQRSSAPELVSPAGIRLESVYAAVDYGADAVYLGVKNRRMADRLLNELSVRGEIACFTPEEVETAQAYCSKHGVRIKVVLNKLFTEKQREEACETAGKLFESGIRTIVASDLQFIEWVRARLPDMAIHVSIIGGTANRHTAGLYRQAGASRVILENNLSWNDLRLLRKNVDIELEMFAFGLTCLAMHGSCALSPYLSGLACSAPCTEAVEIESDKVPEQASYLRGRDLNQLALVPALADLGVDALKIEGRMRSTRYVKIATSALRYAIDAWKEGREPTLPARLARAVDTLPFFGSGEGCLGEGTPEPHSICTNRGSTANKLRDMVRTPGLAACLIRRKTRKMPPLVAQLPVSATGLPDGLVLPSRPELIVETSLFAPVIPRGADVIAVGERHCCQRLLNSAGKLPGLLLQIEESGAKPALIMPGRVPEGQVDAVVKLALSLKDRVSRVTCHDPGVARCLSSELDVVLCTNVAGTQDAEAAARHSGACRVRPLCFPLPRYARDGFPRIPLEILVLGHAALNGGIYCLSRWMGARCLEGCASGTVVRHPGMELFIDGNTLYSSKVSSAHELREYIASLPLAGLVFNSVGLECELLEQALSYWRGGELFPSIPESGVCNGMYLNDLHEHERPPVPWQQYFALKDIEFVE